MQRTENERHKSATNNPFHPVFLTEGFPLKIGGIAEYLLVKLLMMTRVFERRGLSVDGRAVFCELLD